MLFKISFERQILGFLIVIFNIMEVISNGEAKSVKPTKCTNGLSRNDDLYHFGPDGQVLHHVFSEWEEFIRNMPVRETDYWVISIPRSGTTWVQEMLWLLANHVDLEEARRTRLDDRFIHLEETIVAGMAPGQKYTSMEQLAMHDFAKSRFIKTHLHWDLLPRDLLNSNAKIIFVIRNPKDACVSWYHLLTEAGSFRATLDEFGGSFLNNKVPFTPYWASVKKFHAVLKERDQRHTLLVTYEELKKDLKNNGIYRVRDLIRKKCTEEMALKLEHHLSFDQMKSNNAVNSLKIFQNNNRQVFGSAQINSGIQFIRKGEVDSWKAEMSEDCVRKFDAWILQKGIAGLY